MAFTRVAFTHLHRHVSVGKISFYHIKPIGLIMSHCTVRAAVLHFPLPNICLVFYNTKIDFTEWNKEGILSAYRHLVSPLKWRLSSWPETRFVVTGERMLRTFLVTFVISAATYAPPSICWFGRSCIKMT